MTQSAMAFTSRRKMVEIPTAQQFVDWPHKVTFVFGIFRVAPGSISLTYAIQNYSTLPGEGWWVQVGGKLTK